MSNENQTHHENCLLVHKVDASGINVPNTKRFVACNINRIATIHSCTVNNGTYNDLIMSSFLTIHIKKSLVEEYGHTEA